MLIAFDIETLTWVPGYCPKCHAEDTTKEEDKVICNACGHKGSPWTFSNPNWRDYYPLEIAIVAAGYMVPEIDEPGLKFWYGDPGRAMTQDEIDQLIDEMVEWNEAGHSLLAWNGLHFDLRNLAGHCPHRLEELSDIAMNMVDPMFTVVCTRGHRLGLDKACQGAGIAGKKHEVTLDDGSILTDMDGSKAPKLWAEGEANAVIDYLAEDIGSLLRLAEYMRNYGVLPWITGKGGRQHMEWSRNWTVRESLTIPVPDTSWMSGDPPIRSEFLDWTIQGGAKT